MKFTIHEAQAGMRLDKVLVDRVPGLGRTGAKRLFAEGKVRLSRAADGVEATEPQRPRRPRRAVKGDVAAAGDVVEVELAEETSDGPVADVDAPLVVLLETPEVVVVDKPAGQPT